MSAESQISKRQDVYPFIDLSRFAGKLKGKVVLITGASSGIGRSTVLAFASCGASVACVARRKELLDSLTTEIKDTYSVPTISIPADLAKDTSAAAKSIVDQVTSSLGPVDILINNAALHTISKLIDHQPFETWSEIVNFGLNVPAALTHAVLPSMIERNQGGILINIASSSGAHDTSHQTAYAVAKSGGIRLFQSLPGELKGTGISCFNIHPGTVWTEMVEKGFTTAIDKYKDLFTAEDAGKMQFQTLQQAANSIVTICSDERFKVMDGKYINAEQDLEEVLKVAESGRVEKERLYWLKVDEL